MSIFRVEKEDEEDARLFTRVLNAILALPEIDLGVDSDGKKVILSCHILARAVGITFDLYVRDGKFLNFFEHSWIKTPAGNIIDVLPVGVLSGPMHVKGDVIILSRTLYSELSPDKVKETYGEMFSSRWFRHSVKLVAIELCEINARNKVSESTTEN